MERRGSAKDPIWDANTHEFETGNHEEDEEQGRTPMHAGDEYNLANAHPGRPVSWEPLGAGHAPPPFEETEYRGASSYQAPSAMSPTVGPEGEDGSGRGRYGGGYSFR